MKPTCTHTNCHEPAYGHGHCKTHDPLWTPAHEEYRDRVTPEPKDWPKGAERDGLTYRLEVTQNVDTEYVDGKFIETPKDPNYTHKPTFPKEYIGTYAQIAQRAAHLNRMQEGGGGWIFYPRGPLSMAAA